ncbi:MAG: hypothetical protein V8S96_07060 [Lachnospiraceae bacterium]
MNIDIRKETEQIRNYVVNLRKHFHQNPELSMEEWETSERIKTELEEMEIPYIRAGRDRSDRSCGKGRTGDRAAG